MTVGEKIREARKSHGWNQTTLAGKVGITLQTISRWEKGEREPKAGELKRIASALGVSIAYLMGEEDTIEVSTPSKSPDIVNQQKREEQITAEEIDKEMQALMQILSKDNLIRKSARMMQDMTEEEKYKVFQYIQDQEFIARMKEEKDA